MTEKKLETVTRLIAMILVVIYTGIGICLLKDKLATIHTTTSASTVTEEMGNEPENDTQDSDDAEEFQDVVHSDHTSGEKDGDNSQVPQIEQGTGQEGTEQIGEESGKEEADNKQNDFEASEPVYTDAPEGYFKDALFIGDSRTVGLMEYGGIKEGTYFATEGMSVYNVQKDKVSVGEIGSVSLDTLLAKKKFGKVYLMLGINELGYDHDKTIRKFGELVDKIKKAQPSAVIYIEANLHVSASRSGSDSTFNNKNINKFNKAITKFADNQTIFYLDVNPLFDDKNGNLAKEYTSDNTHVLGKYYRTWTDWIATQAIVK